MRERPQPQLFPQDRPERLIDVLAVAHERPTKNAFVDGPNFAERAVAAAVAHGGARLEAVRPQGVEGEVDYLPRAVECGTSRWPIDR